MYACRRPPIFYDANEVKQWLEARKKNYPTTVNINKVNVHTYVFLLDLGNFMSARKEHLLTAYLIMQKLSQSQSDGRKKDEEAQMRRQVSQSSIMIHHVPSLGFKGNRNWSL